MAEIARYLFLDNFMDDDDEEALHRTLNRVNLMSGSFYRCLIREVAKIEGYAECVVPLYSLDDFRYHYRLTRGIFEQILLVLAPHLIPEAARGKEVVDPSKQLLICMWYLSNQESMREVGQMFGVSKSTTHCTVKRVMCAMCTHMLQLIQWPDEHQQNIISDALNASHRLPGIIGFVDGTHIRLAHVLGNDQDYINRKGFPSIQLQVVVDDKMLIRNAYAGWPGCTHDARVLRNSALYEEAEAGRCFNEGKCLIGDSAYPVRHWLITPFRDNGHLTLDQRRLNRQLSSTRQIVERTIGHIKCRFRRMRCIHLYNIDTIVKSITCACILHNVCVMGGDELDDFIEADPDIHPNNYQPVFGNAADGLALRNNLMAMLR